MILTVDELEARLHPKLTQAVVDLFREPRRNPSTNVHKLGNGIHSASWRGWGRSFLAETTTSTLRFLRMVTDLVPSQ